MTTTTTTEIDFNIGLAISKTLSFIGPDLLTIVECDRELRAAGFEPVSHRFAGSATEPTYIVRCEDLQGGVDQAARIYALAGWLQQDAIAAVPHHGAPALCVGPNAHHWGGCFLAQHWISLA